MRHVVEDMLVWLVLELQCLHGWYLLFVLTIIVFVIVVACKSAHRGVYQNLACVLANATFQCKFDTSTVITLRSLHNYLCIMVSLRRVYVATCLVEACFVLQLHCLHVFCTTIAGFAIVFGYKCVPRVVRRRLYCVLANITFHCVVKYVYGICIMVLYDYFSLCA